MRHVLVVVLVAAGMVWGPGQADGAIVLEGYVQYANYQDEARRIIYPDDAWTLTVLDFDYMADVPGANPAIPSHGVFQGLLQVGGLVLGPGQWDSFLGEWRIGSGIRIWDVFPKIGGMLSGINETANADEWGVQGWVTGIREDVPHAPEPASAAVWCCLVGLTLCQLRRLRAGHLARV